VYSKALAVLDTVFVLLPIRNDYWQAVNACGFLICILNNGGFWMHRYIRRVQMLFNLVGCYMATTAKTGKNLKFSTEEGANGVPNRHAKNARLALYKAKKANLKFDCGLVGWPEEDLKSLLYEMSVEGNENI
jgi:hypothetical protein